MLLFLSLNKIESKIQKNQQSSKLEKTKMSSEDAIISFNE